MHLEFADPDFPGFITPSHETAKIGADNPDNLYRYARLNGAQRYRVSGQRGSVAYLSFGTQKRRLRDRRQDDPDRLHRRQPA